MGEQEIIKYTIPTAVPLVFEFDSDFKPTKHYFLLDEKELKERIAAVEKQGKVKQWCIIFSQRKSGSYLEMIEQVCTFINGY